MSTIFIENDIFKTLDYYLKINFTKGSKLIIITDENLNNIYGDLLEQLKLLSTVIFVKTISIPPSETSKSREMKSIIEDQMLELRCSRDTIIIAFGGGVVLDLAGFVAATFCRGIPVIYVPTTLLAQVDASIGGKTGINTKHGKNLIGAFKQPNSIIFTKDFLSTLPDNEYYSAFAEVIKHAIIFDENYFNFLKNNAEKAKFKDPEFLHKIIKRSIEIKSQIVKKDEKEKNLRAILNFGHTIGHAIEQAHNYKINHGQAVAHGILIESYISFKLNILSKDNYEQIKNIISLYNINNLLLPQLDTDKIEICVNYLATDKKNQNNQIGIVLIKNIGNIETQNSKYIHSIGEKNIKIFLKNYFEKT